MNKNEHRIAIGATLALILPVCLLGSLPVPGKPDYWWYTISDSYWYCSGFPLMMGACSILLILYKSYSRLDNIINRLSALTAIAHVVFPCSDPYGFERIGLFQLPPDTSNIIHNCMSVVMLSLEVFNIAFLFTRGKNRRANRVYRICAILIVLCMIGFFLCMMGLLPAPAKFPFEVTVLLCVSFSWMVKGHLF